MAPQNVQAQRQDREYVVIGLQPALGVHVSWSIHTVLGTPNNVLKQLDDEVKNLGAATRAEYEVALPHLKGLVALTSENSDGSRTQLIKLHAAGSKSESGSQCVCSIEVLTADLSSDASASPVDTAAAIR